MPSIKSRQSDIVANALVAAAEAGELQELQLLLQDGNPDVQTVVRLCVQPADHQQTNNLQQYTECAFRVATRHCGLQRHWETSTAYASCCGMEPMSIWKPAEALHSLQRVRRVMLTLFSCCWSMGHASIRRQHQVLDLSEHSRHKHLCILTLHCCCLQALQLFLQPSSKSDQQLFNCCYRKAQILSALMLMASHHWLLRRCALLALCATADDHFTRVCLHDSARPVSSLNIASYTCASACAVLHVCQNNWLAVCYLS